MSVILEIHDGNPYWYLNLDIWTVPNDPSGSPDLPTAGQACYLYARVTNNGSSQVQNATVKFYWANPAVGFNRVTANLIGQSNVTLDPGQSYEVLCLTPWIPTYVNSGHECILAEVFHASDDPLPSSPDFNVPTDRHVAQRNISVINAAAGMFMLVFEVHNNERKENKFQLIVEQGKLSALKTIAPYLGKNIPLNIRDGNLVKTVISDVICPDLKLLDSRNTIKDTTLPAFGKKTFSLAGKLDGEAALINVIQKNKFGSVVGGLSALVINKK